MQIVYTLLDVFFLVFHSAFTIFNMFGWISVKTRKVHCATMLITGCSWFILGIWYGWGYCFCTDWHWQVREKMGQPVLFNSYIQFLVHEITGYTPDTTVTDAVVAGVYFLCLFLTVLLNIRDYLNKRRLLR